MSGHSAIPPSSAKIWGAPGGCTGWPKMSAQFPDEAGEAAENGTASHYVGECLIKVSTGDKVNPVMKDVYIGKPAENGVIVTEEMYEAAELYANDVLSELKKHPSGKWDVETKVHATDIHPESFGTVDAHLYDPDTNILIVWDYKYGRGLVEAFENWQAINYISGLFKMYGIYGGIDQTLRVEIRIVQPRAFHRDGSIRKWVVKGSDLRGYFNILKNNAEKALSDQAETRSGEHCRYCKARHACPAAVKAGINLFEAVDRPIPAELTPEQLGTQLAIVKRALKQLEYLESGYETQLKTLIQGGVNVPGWAFTSAPGRAKWNKPVEEILQLGDLMGVDLKKPLDVITPTQAKNKGMDESLIVAYSERAAGKIKVTQCNNNKARQIFN